MARIVPDALWLLRMPALLPHPPPPPSKRTEKHLRGFSGAPTAKESGPRKSPAGWRDFSGGDSAGAWGEISGVNSSKEESVESSPHPQGQGEGSCQELGGGGGGGLFVREKRLLNYQPNVRVLCPLVRKTHILLPLGEQRPQEGHEDPGKGIGMGGGGASTWNTLS